MNSSLRDVEDVGLCIRRYICVLHRHKIVLPPFTIFLLRTYFLRPVVRTVPRLNHMWNLFCLLVVSLSCVFVYNRKMNWWKSDMFLKFRNIQLLYVNQCVCSWESLSMYWSRSAYSTDQMCRFHNVSILAFATSERKLQAVGARKKWFQFLSCSCWWTHSCLYWCVLLLFVLLLCGAG